MLVGDMVVQTANAPGTGTFNLIAPPAGRSTFVSQCGAGQVFYFAQDSSSWEKGVGTLVAGSPDTLSRDTVLGNSNGNTAKISFAGSTILECNIPAERSLWASADGTLVDVGSRRLANLARGAAASDAMRVDQSVFTVISTTVVANGTFGVGFPIPSGYREFCLYWAQLTSSNASGQLYMRYSGNGGSSYDASNTYYNVNDQRSFSGSGDGTSRLLTSSVLLSGPSSSQTLMGRAYFEIGPTMLDFRTAYNDASTFNILAGGVLYGGAPPNALMLLHSSGNFTGGVVTLLGRPS